MRLQLDVLNWPVDEGWLDAVKFPAKNSEAVVVPKKRVRERVAVLQDL